MHKTYQPQLIESHCLAKWAQQAAFQASGVGDPYCIMLPPPNVTGSLHMGHGFQVSLMDALIRYQRMCGKNVLWQGGTDHAGIATQALVERQLADTGQSRIQLGRERFLAAVWAWKAQSGDRITQQLQRLGASIDPARDRFTCDEGFTQAVTTVLIQLHQAGLLYRGKRLVNWDPQLLTAISDLEVNHQEEAGFLYYLRYPLCNHPGAIIVATTRPETLFGDVAVAVHPQDSRYQALIGQPVQLPLTDRLIPIIADEQVDPNFGTGCVKITPAHDFNDYALGQRHQLSPINILTPEAQLNEQVPLPWQGMDRLAARESLITALTARQSIEKTEEHTLKIPRGDRSGAIIEPYLTDQWFIRMKPLAEPAIAAIKAGHVRFVPENWANICLQWLENIEDWCISRQLWWGHRIPAWYGPQGEVFVGADEASVRQQYQLDATFSLRQEEDVLDTWVSSALWPFVTLGWPNQTPEFHTFYPTDVLVTGFDIIFFWVARMLMMSLYLTQQLPFKTVYVTGLIRDHLGQKMSKSKGNVLDPLDIIDGIDSAALIQKRTQGLIQPHMASTIEKLTRQQFPEGIQSFGTDALRLTYYALAAPTRDIRFDLNRTAGYRNFCNKLWQATRFVLSHSQGDRDPHPDARSVFDRWILSQLHQTIAQAHLHFSHYRFDLLVQTLYEFVWYDFCDWYLELVKPVLTASMPDFQNASPAAARHTLISVLETVVRLLHPLMPFITEALWQSIASLNIDPHLKEDTAHYRLLSQVAYPVADIAQHESRAVALVSQLQQIIRAIRGLRSKLKLAPHQVVPLFCTQASLIDQPDIDHYQAYIKHLARISTIQWLDPQAAFEPAAMTQVGTLVLRIPLAGLVDVKTEVIRLQKAQRRLEKALVRSQQSLVNPHFLAKAPSELVEKARVQLATDAGQLEKIKQQLTDLQAHGQPKAF